MDSGPKPSPAPNPGRAGTSAGVGGFIAGSGELSGIEMSRTVHERVAALAGMVDEVKEVLNLAADYSENGRLDDTEIREAAEATYEVLGKLLGKVA
jgi:hypothetical protein